MPQRPWFRRPLTLVLAGLTLVIGGVFVFKWATYPSDRTPEGAYLRVMSAVNRAAPKDLFPYIETAAQHASYTIGEYRRKGRNRVLSAYPEPERARVAADHAAEAAAPDGSDVFAIYARKKGWLQQLRRDLSGVAKVEINGQRATVQTVRGTRYPFRRRENGIWGLTLFTATLLSEAERAARDYSVIDKAAKDYERVGQNAAAPHPASP